MGYTTEFDGRFIIYPQIDEVFAKYIDLFNRARHMKRKVGRLYGIEGEYYVKGGPDDYHSKNIVDNNEPPITQPGLWCQWTVAGNYLQWDGGEKFYNYVGWLQYLINNFFGPEGYILNGNIKWQGERREDFGRLEVDKNVITVYQGFRTRKRNLIAAKLLSGEGSILIYEPEYKGKLNYRRLLGIDSE